MRLLVTGGAGYIGSVVVDALLRDGHVVTVVDDLSTGHADAVPGGAEFVPAAITELAPVLAARPQFDGALHFAAKSLVGESMSAPERYWHNNVGGSLALLDALRAAGMPRLVFSSSAATYGEPEQVPITEDAPTRPASPYGATKLAVDLMLASEASAHGLAAVSLRYFNVAGAVGPFGERHATETHLIPIALQVAAGSRESLALYGEDYPTPDGSCVRDYIHVADLARAHLLALRAATAGTHEIYNLGNGAGFSVHQVLDAVREVTSRPVPTVHAERRPGDPATLVASAAKIREALGWTPQIPGITDMVADAWTFLNSRGGR